MIVSYDEHEVNNTFKFGVIYQKFRQVSFSRAAFVEHVPVHQRSTSHKHRLNSDVILPCAAPRVTGCPH